VVRPTYVPNAIAPPKSRCRTLPAAPQPSPAKHLGRRLPVTSLARHRLPSTFN
jgi:hypothetical protein